jgi:hypothetical protein
VSKRKPFGESRFLEIFEGARQIDTKMFIPIAISGIWVVTAVLVAEYSLGAPRPNGDDPRWGFDRRPLLLRSFLFSGVLGLAVLPLLTTRSAFALLLAILGREAARYISCRVSPERPFQRELLFFLFQWIPFALWLWIFGQSAAQGPESLIRFYGHPFFAKALVWAAGLYWVVYGGSVWVRTLLDQLGEKPVIRESLADSDGEEESEPEPAAPPTSPEIGEMEPARVGQVIGYLERILIFALVLVDQWTAIGFILTAKSVARFKKLEKQEFAEYYLLGTLASTLVALAAASIVGYTLETLIPGNIPLEKIP